jgi:hypothetical protein
MGEATAMHIPVLIEPIAEGRFRARAGEPFSASAEGDSADDARHRLESLLRDRLQGGPQVATIDLGHGAPAPCDAPLHLEPVPDDDWFFKTMREAIAENRQREDGAGP